MIKSVLTHGYSEMVAVMFSQQKDLVRFRKHIMVWTKISLWDTGHKVWSPG